MTTPPKTVKITGPPGCGKSTYLKKQIIRACERYFPNRIGAVTFTNAGVEEIKNKISETTGESRNVAKNVRTIHSHCYGLLELNNKHLAEANIKEFNQAHPEFTLESNRLSNRDDDEEAFMDTRHSEKLFAEMQVNRNRMIPEDKWMPDVLAIWKAWQDWMIESNYIDFTGMLEKVLESKLKPDIDILFVDEAQDLSPLQFALIKMWSQDLNQTIYAGDSDQSIFRFSGTIPEAFINLQHDWIYHLEQSYRVPRAVHDYADKIINLSKNREITTYKPVSSDMAEYKGEGKIYLCLSPDLSLEGTHMILCRCKYQLKRWMEILEKNNYIWHNPYRPEDKNWNPTLTQSWIAARTYYDLMTGRSVSPSDFKMMVARLKPGFAKHGLKTQVKDWNPGRDKDKIDMFNLSNTKIL